MDIFEIVSQHSSIDDSINLSLINQEINKIVSKDLNIKKNKIMIYLELILKIKKYFGKDNQTKIYSQGLKESIKNLIIKKILSFRDILLLQKLSDSKTKEANFVKKIFLFDYNTQQKDKLTITIGSLLEQIVNQPVNIFFNQHGLKLKIYYQDSNSQKFLPNCVEGQFYSWGFVDRVSGIGNMSDYPTLNLKSNILIDK